MPRPNYGVDAPGVVVGFAAGSIAAGLAAVALLALGAGYIAGLGAVLALASFVFALLCGSMLAYAFGGKQRMRDHLLDLWTWRGDETVLDTGAGRGLLAIAAAKRVPRGRVVAVDVWSTKDLSGNSPAALERNGELEGVSGRIDIVTADARSLPVADQSVDVVGSMFCIHNIEPETERATACREIARVLKPGGMALITDFPTVRPYVDVLRAAGLVIDGPHRGELIARSISGHLIARKPG